MPLNEGVRERIEEAAEAAKAKAEEAARIARERAEEAGRAVYERLEGVDKTTAVAVGAGLIGVGVATYAIGTYLSKKALIDEYVREAREYQKALVRAYDDGVVDEDEERFLNMMQDALSQKEKTIEAAGLGYDLVRALEVAFNIAIVYAAYKITPRLIEELIRRYRPPRWKCSICDREFNTEDELQRHLAEDHHATDDVTKYSAVVDALEETPDWFKGLVADALDWTFDQVDNIGSWWDSLPTEQKIAIGIAIAATIILIIALAVWFGFVPTVGVAAASAAACIV